MIQGSGLTVPPPPHGLGYHTTGGRGDHATLDHIFIWVLHVQTKHVNHLLMISN